MQKQNLKDINVIRDKTNIKIKFLINGIVALIIYFLIPLGKRKQDYILIGSHLGEQYVDNNKVFFEYCINKNENIYWVLNKNSIAEKMNSYTDNIVYRGSIKGFLMAYRSKCIIVSHSFADVVPIFYKLKKQLNLKAIFVSHGVYGFKKAKLIKPNYYQQFEFITAVGEREKLIKQTSLNLEENQVKILGLPRFDKLVFNKGNGNILVMLTWRDQKYLDIEASEYYIQLKKLLQNKRLIDYLDEKKIKVNVVLHPFVHQYYDSIEILESENIVILPRNTDIQQELIKNSLLITDYSSVSWDFAYMNKPVIFYQFDLKEYLNNRGSYLDLYNELFGIQTFTAEETVDSIISIIEDNYLLKNQKNFITDYIKFIDKNNCERLHQAIHSIIL